MNTPLEECNILAGLLRDIAARLPFKTPPSVIVEGDGDDPRVTLCGWLVLFPVEGKRKTIAGDRPTWHWQLSKVVYDSGVRYHSDGSGTPLSEDIVDVGELETTTPRAAAAAMAALWMSALDVVLDAMAEDALADMAGEGGF